MAAHGNRAAETRTGVGGFRALGRALVQGLSIGLLLIMLGIGVLAVGVPAAVGGTPYSVLTGSMTPTYPPGTLIIVRPTPVEEIRIGDALTYQIESGKPAVVTHRVISILQDSAGGAPRFITQGDANTLPDDPPVLEVQIKGTVWYAIPWLGYANQWVNGEARGVVIPAIAALLFAYASWMVLSGIRERRRSRSRGDDGGSADPPLPDGNGEAPEPEHRHDADDGAEREDR